MENTNDKMVKTLEEIKTNFETIQKDISCCISDIQKIIDENNDNNYYLVDDLNYQNTLNPKQIRLIRHNLDKFLMVQNTNNFL